MNGQQRQKNAGLYRPSFEHDNCGIGAIVNIKGQKSHDTVANALKIVEQLEHRAGKDAEGKTGDGYILFWTAPKAETEMDKAIQYVVYRFGSKEKVNLDDPSHIVAITRNPFYKLPYETGKTKYRYVVTALDRIHNESKSVSKKVKL